MTCYVCVCGFHENYSIRERNWAWINISQSCVICHNMLFFLFLSHSISCGRLYWKHNRQSMKKKNMSKIMTNHTIVLRQYYLQWIALLPSRCRRHHYSQTFSMQTRYTDWVPCIYTAFFLFSNKRIYDTPSRWCSRIDDETSTGNLLAEQRAINKRKFHNFFLLLLCALCVFFLFGVFCYFLFSQPFGVSFAFLLCGVYWSAFGIPLF